MVQLMPMLHHWVNVLGLLAFPTVFLGFSVEAMITSSSLSDEPLVGLDGTDCVRCTEEVPLPSTSISLRSPTDDLVKVHTVLKFTTLEYTAMNTYA